MRQKVWQRDRGICAECGSDCEKIKRVYWRIRDKDAQAFYAQIVRYNGKVFWEMDHILERSLTPDHSLSNLQTLCMPCHRRKTAMYMRERRSVANEAARQMLLERRRKFDLEQEREEVLRKRREEDLAFEREVAEAERKILEARGHKFVPTDIEERVDFVLEFVHSYINRRVEENGGYWPKTLEPIESDRAADLWILG